MSLSLPPQGLYEGCAPHRNASRCLDRLKMMAAAGFKLVLNYDQLYGTSDQQLAYAEQAHSLGMKVIWDMSYPVFWNGTNLLSYYKELAATCNCSDNRGFIRYVVNLVRDLPATWGYYVGDELPRADHAKVKPFSDLVHQLDPSHPRLYVGIGSPNGSNLDPFVDIAEVIGADYYPIGTPTEELSKVGAVARITQFIAGQNKKQSVMVLQAFSAAEYPRQYWSCSPFPACTRYPTEPEMRQMLDLTLQNSRPPFVLWYSYFDILRSDNPALRWSNLVAAVSQGKHMSTPT